MSQALDLEEVVLIGRTFEEYYKMFGLEDLELSEERILDVASGVASFGAEARELDYEVVSSDRIYKFAVDKIEGKCAQDLAAVMGKLAEIKEMYNWDFFTDIDELKEYRARAYKTFLKEFSNNSDDKYKYVNYPDSNFNDNEFTVSLVSHFLFLYDDQLDYNFHKQTLQELIRVTNKEIRIFPLVNLKGEKSDFVQWVKEDEEFDGFDFEVRKVDYEFIKGGNEFLKIKSREEK
jgi:hypothetical protein